MYLENRTFSYLNIFKIHKTRSTDFYVIEQAYTCYFTTEIDMLHCSNKTIIGTVRTAYNKNKRKTQTHHRFQNVHS